ncbi:LysR family transcriptional regulator [Providencia rettgeri]|nr:LysR family transcriptional regulator [Providencia rettgeri]
MQKLVALPLQKKLNMSKASISRHIREIEEKLGVQLCERGPSGFKLTESGLFVIEKPILL